MRVHTSDVSVMMSISMGNDCLSKNDATLPHLLRILSIGKKSEKQFLPIFIDHPYEILNTKHLLV